MKFGFSDSELGSRNLELSSLKKCRIKTREQNASFDGYVIISFYAFEDRRIIPLFFAFYIIMILSYVVK
jgi:hypothetical protein